VGALWVAPMLLAAVWVPSAGRLAKHAKLDAVIAVRSLLWTITASSIAVLVFLMFAHLQTHRYETDFEALGILAAIANLTIYVCESTGYKKKLWITLMCGLIGYSMVTNLALGIAGPYHDVLKNRPVSYLRIARWLSPIREFRPVMNPAIRVDLAAEFVRQPPGFREPLVSIGGSHHQYHLYAEHAGKALSLVSQSEASKMIFEISELPDGPLSVRVMYSPRWRKLTVHVNGRAAIEHPIETLVTAPAEVSIGENRSDPALTARRFTGMIHTLDKRIE